LIKGNSIAELCWETENPYNYIQRAKERKAEEDSTERREERKSETLHPFNLPLFSLLFSPHMDMDFEKTGWHTERINSQPMMLQFCF
jgi:hypothetical protein